MRKIATKLEGVFLLEPRIFGDDRGFFMESYNKEVFVRLGITTEFVQDNHSKSVKGVLRGLHYQLGREQAKLVRVVAGAVYDVVVDIRVGSPSFGVWYGVELSAANKLQLYVPQGFAHGFYTLEDDTEFLYKCSDFYVPAAERTILWNDTTVGVDWNIAAADQPLLSQKDLAGLPLESYTAADLPQYT